MEYAINRLRNHKAARVCHITAEILKYGGADMAKWLHRVISVVWQSGNCPQDWKRALIVPLFKKGDRSKCDNYRGISLLSVPGKVYTLVLLNRVKDYVDDRLSELQCGFRPNRGCPDQIFPLRKTMELAVEHDAPLYACFIDLRKAYDSVNRAHLWRILQQYGIPTKIIQLLRDLLYGTEAAVHMYGSKSDWFGVHTGVRQGCVIAPLLFNVFVDYLARVAMHSIPFGFKIGYMIHDQLVWPRTARGVSEMLLQFFLYADDMVLLSDSPSGLRDMLLAFEEITQTWGMHINVDKTKILCVGKNCTWPSVPVRIRDQAVGVVDKFTYLGSVVNRSNSLDDEIANRVSKAGAAFWRLNTCLWKCKHVSLNTKLAVFRVAVLPCLLYASETWTPLKRHENTLSVFLHRCLRRILGVSRRDRVRNSDLYAQCGNQPSIDRLLCRARLRWLGHLGRLDFGRVCKCMLTAGCVPGYKRPRQGRRKRWNDLAQKDLDRVKLGRARWPEVCHLRSVWRTLVAEAVSG